MTDAFDSQIEIVRDLLTSGNSITSMEAFRNYGMTRLSGIIFVLRKRGYNIDTIMIEGKNRFGKDTRYAKYRLNEIMPYMDHETNEPLDQPYK